MVDKSDLMKAVWPDTFVEEGALARNISLLRKTLGDTGDEPAYIETIPKRGYRFVAPVRAARAMPQPPSPKSAPKRMVWVAILLLTAIAAIAALVFRNRGAPPVTLATAPATSLAVLPLRSLEKDASQDYFADGMTQALITGLAKLRKLRVVSLASEAGGRRDAAAWNAILRDQSVNRVLTGTILRSGGRVRIDAQLMDPKTRAVHWANSYERDLQDVLALESEVAEAIAGEIQVSLTAEDRERLRQRRPAKPEALDAYLRGRYFWNRRTEDALRRAAQCFEQALKTDPTFALAYSGLADSYSLLGSVGFDGMPPNQAMPLAKSAARKALEPLSPIINVGVGRCFYYSRQYDRAIEQYRSVAEVDPSFAMAHLTLGMAYQQKGLFEQAIEEFKRAAAFSDNGPASVAALASVDATAGKLVEAKQELARLEEMSRTRYVPALYFATIHAAMGDHAKAIGWIWEAIGERSDYLMYLRVEPRADKLSGNPEFIRAMAALHP